MDFDIIYLNGGKGTRVWPLTLVNPFLFYPKSMVRIKGTTLAESQLYLHGKAGAKQLHIVAQYGENREFLSERLNQEYGNIFGMKRVTWTHPFRDNENTGSGSALMQAIRDHPDLKGNAIVLPNDNLFEYDIKKALQHHVSTGAVMTILTAMVPAKDTLSRYGVIDRNNDNSVKGMLEKPKSLEDLTRNISGDKTIDENTLLPVSGGAYIINIDALKELLPSAISGEFDIANQMIPTLLNSGVQTYDLKDWADLGGLDLLLNSVQRTLNGNFPYLNNILEKSGSYVELPNNVWIHKETLYDIEIEGKNLARRMYSEGPDKVTIGPNVCISRKVFIHPGATISNSEIGKDSRIGTNVNVRNSYLSFGTQIGPGSKIDHSITALYSTFGPETQIHKSVIGNRVNVPTGVHLDETVVWPLFRFQDKPAGYKKEILMDEALKAASPGRYWPSEKHELELAGMVSRL